MDRIEGLSGLDGGALDYIYELLSPWEVAYFDHKTGILYQAFSNEGKGNFVRADVVSFVES